jgi:hypothetical protein
LTGRLRRFVTRIVEGDVPDDVAGRLVADERMVAVGTLADGGHLVATTMGLWWPEDDGPRRVGWHLISKATWNNTWLSVIEAEETGTVDDAVFLTDRPARRWRLARPGKMPETVHARVTGSIRSRHHRDLPGGGAWVVQRSAPGRDGIVLQVRADPGTDPQAVRAFAAQVAQQVRNVRRGQ